MLTKNIKLNKKDTWVYRLMQVGIFALFAATLIILGIKVIFPSKTFRLNTTNVNDSDNNVSEVKISPDTLVFNASDGNPFSTVSIKIFGDVGNELPSISIKKSYEAFMYPTAQPITELGEIEINKLILEGESVYIVGNGKLYPIDRPETFESAGFKWENIQDSKDTDLNQYEKQKLFNYTAVHPTGTIFKAVDSGKYYIIIDEKKHEIKGDLLKNLELRKQAIQVNENISTKKCESKKHYINQNISYCNISLDNIQEEAGKDYKITITNTNPEKITRIESKFIKELNEFNLKRGVKNILNAIKARYLN